MEDIGELLEYILKSIYGKDVRQAIVDAISKCYLDASTGFSADFKDALYNLVSHIGAWTDGNAQQYIDDLVTAMNPPADLSYISAEYSQSGTVYDYADLDSLRADLVVTAHYTDLTTETVHLYELSGTLSESTSEITVSYKGKTATFEVDVTSSILYNWDFTDSLIDSVGGVTAVLNNCERTDEGIVFDASTDYVTLGDVFGFDRTMEIDYSDASAAFGNVNGIWFWTSSPIQSGFGYRYGSSGSTRHYGWYSQDTAHWHMDTNTSKTFINGTGTLKVTIDSEGNAKAYVDNEEMTLLYNGAATKYTDETHASYITLGSSDSNYPAFYNTKITGVRIYEGVR